MSYKPLKEIVLASGKLLEEKMDEFPRILSGLLVFTHPHHTPTHTEALTHAVTHTIPRPLTFTQAHTLIFRTYRAGASSVNELQRRLEREPSPTSP